MRRREAFIGVLPLLATPLLAQKYLSSPRRALTAPELKDAPDEFLDRSLQWVDDILRQYPPSKAEHPVRRAALIRLDDLLHIESAPSKPLIQSWYRQRMAATAKEIASTKPTTGAKIWKLYNHTFFIRTATASFVYDLVPGPPRIEAFSMSEDTLKLLADTADALFISHWHEDHANPHVGELFFERNKPVVGPADIWREKPELRPRLTTPPRSTSQWQSAGNLKYLALPGHQGKDVINNCNLIRTPEGLTFLQTGDQSNDDDFQWIDKIHQSHKVDVLFPNCWTPSPLRLLQGINPRLVIPGHENEMAHVVPHREDWTQTYNRFHGAPMPVVPMAWGESISL